MDLPGKGIPYWLDSTPRTNYPALQGNLDVDVAVLGGGIVGVTAAFLLKDVGMRVALVEARRVLEGVTGHTTGKLTSLHRLVYKPLMDRFDRERAYLYAEANQAAIELVATLVEQRGIACDFARLPAYTYTLHEGDIAQIEAEVRVAQELGLPASFEQSVPLPYDTRGAVCFQDQARFHPRKYLLALADAIPGDGSHIFEHTVAVDVDDGQPAVVTTNRGRIRARDVIVATHFPFLDRGLYFTRQTPKYSYVLGVYVNQSAPQGMFISTDPNDYQSIRPQPTDEGMMLIIGGGKHITGQGGDNRRYFRDLESWVRQHFDVRSIAYRWATQDNYPVDGVPYVGKYTSVSRHLYVATGFFGWGMTNGTAAAMLLTDMLLGRSHSWEAVYDPSRVWQPKTLVGIAQLGSHNAGRFLKDLMSGGEHLRPEDVAPGEGKVIDYEGRKLAVHRDLEGKLHMVSAICGHQGCTVAWNNAEMTWDCPCHSSRYTVDGEFIHGPTVKNLGKVEMPEELKQEKQPEPL